MLCSVIKDETCRFLFLKDNPGIMEEKKDDYSKLFKLEGQNAEGRPLPDEILTNSLRTLCLCRRLHKPYAQIK